jgi:hypothetical protein
MLLSTQTGKVFILTDTIMKLGCHAIVGVVKDIIVIFRI